MVVSFVNSQGARYYLFRNNRNKNLFFFSSKKTASGSSLVGDIPVGRKIVESKITGLPLLAKK